jgi:FMN phosphatase YigB (HAD superfamily)
MLTAGVQRCPFTPVGTVTTLAKNARIAPEAAVFLGDCADDELNGATRAGLRAFRASWFLARWDAQRNGDARDQTLQRPEDVLGVAA